MKQFIEIGSSHFRTLRHLCDKGWKGICIDPIDIALKKISSHPNLIKLNVGVSPVEGVYDFIKLKDDIYLNAEEDYQGSATFSDKMAFWNTDLEYKEKVKVKCFTFDTICDSYNITEIDYLKIDTEGMDYEILKSIDFSKYNIKLLRAETNGSPSIEQSIRLLLENNKFFVETFENDLIGVKL